MIGHRGTGSGKAGERGTGVRGHEGIVTCTMVVHNVFRVQLTNR